MLKVEFDPIRDSRGELMLPPECGVIS